MSKSTVLIVDDEYHYLDAISHLLPQDQFTILRAVNGEMACQVALKRHPDIIIMDWDMPVMTGIEATKQLKSEASTRLIPIIMSTGVMTSPEDLQIALRAGAIDFIRKPVEKVELLARMNSVLTIAHSFQKIEKQKRLLEEQKAALERSNLTKERLLSIVAHDVNSPLSSLKGTLGILRLQAKDQTINYEELLDLFDHVEEEFQSVIELMNNLLLWALDQQHALTYSPTSFQLGQLIEPSLRLVNNQLINRNLDLTTDYDADLALFTDRDMLDFIIRNLLSNAIKFTNDGGHISISIAQHENKLLFKVTDTGIGMSDHQLTHLFDQIDPQKSYAATDGKKGTGFGLAMSKEFAQKIGAEIWAESVLGKGSTFYLRLPITNSNIT